MGQRYKIYPKYLFIFPNICTSELRPKVLSFEKTKKIALFFGFLLTYSYLCTRFSA